MALLVIGALYYLSKSSTKEEFENKNDDVHKKKLIFIYADWCGHCTRFKPTWEKIETFSKKNGGFDVQAMNVDDEVNKPFIHQYGVNSFPTLLIFSDGKFMKYQEDRDFDKIISAVENF